MTTLAIVPRVRDAVTFISYTPTAHSPRRDRVAAWLLNGPLTVALGLFTLAVFALWLPGYLSWPMWADHDVFAVLAKGWSAGELPYRDRPSTNFPGPIYQAWVFGQFFGWGGSRIVYAYDALLLVALAVGCIAWSKVRLGWYLPGTMAASILVSYHATHDFAHAAQRDWQATAYALLALLLVAGRVRPRFSLIVSAALFAFAIVSRPQIVLLLPAIAAVLYPIGGWRLGLKWSLGFSAFVGLLFLPLIANGILGDFLRELGRIGEGGIYARPQKDHSKIQFDQFLSSGMPVILILAALFLRNKSFLAWPHVALAGVWFYRPLSPFPHGYLEQPLRVTFALVALAGFAAILKSSLPPTIRLLVVLVTIGFTVDPLPRCCEFDKFGKSWKLLTTGDTHRYVPKGYTKESIPGQHIYPWHEYRQLIEFLQTRTPADAPVANLLLAPTAINGPIGRRTPLHAESMMWLTIVGRMDYKQFAHEIAASPDAIVVWRPPEWKLVPEWHCIPDAVRTHYRPIAIIGDIEVCERRAGP
jgi:hypothetical protein